MLTLIDKEAFFETSLSDEGEIVCLDSNFELDTEKIYSLFELLKNVDSASVEGVALGLNFNTTVKIHKRKISNGWKIIGMGFTGEFISDSYFVKISELTSSFSGTNLLNELMIGITTIFNVKYSLIGIENENSITTVAMSVDGKIVENITYSLKDTPCENVFDKNTCIYTHNVQKLFPNDQILIDLKIESYCGVPIKSPSGKSLGILVVLDTKPMLKKIENTKHVLLLLANKIGIELEREKYEESITFKNLQLKQNNERLLQYAYITSHNLRSPISNIRGLVSLIKITKPEESEMLINMMDLAAQRLDEVVKDLSKIVDFSHEGEDLEKQIINFDEIIEAVKDSLKKIINQFNIEIENSINCSGYHSFKPYIYSIFHNLILNAIKYRRENIDTKIFINVSLIKNTVHISIKDNGLGIDLKNVSNKIFMINERFHKNIEGSGMGLFMVKKQVETLKGTITVQSTVNEGSEFKILLPYKINKI